MNVNNILDTGAQLNSPHSRIHNGQFFIASENNTLVGNGTARTYHIATNTSAHFAFYITSNSNMQVEWLKQVTQSNPGTPLAKFNLNDFSNKTASLIIGTDAILSDQGLTWENDYIFGGTNPNSGGSVSAPRIQEFILKSNDNYGLILTHLDTGTLTYAIRFAWYEPGN